MPALKNVAWWLVIIGAINWGLVGLGYYMGSDYNVVKMIFGSMASVENLVYVLVGLSGAWFLWDKLMIKK